MVKTLEDIIAKHTSEPDLYADEELKKIEKCLAEKDVKIYNIEEDPSEIISKNGLIISKSKDFIGYIENHSVREVFKFLEIIDKESVLVHFTDRIQETIFDVNEKTLKATCEALNVYLDTVIPGDTFNSRIILCIGSYPIIAFVSYSGFEKILELEQELIETMMQTENDTKTIIDRVNDAEKEYEKAYKYLVGDATFRKCTNKMLRKDYERRHVLFKNEQFSNLYWVISNCFRLLTTQEGNRELCEKIRDISYKYNMIYEQAWREIKYGIVQ